MKTWNLQIQLLSTLSNVLSFSFLTIFLLSSHVHADWWSDQRDELYDQVGALDPTVEENRDRWIKVIEEIIAEPCAEPFKTYVSGVNLTCTADSGFQDWTENLKEAKGILVQQGFFSDQDFQDVTFVWCEALGSFAGGLTPMPNRILLNRDFRHESGEMIAPLVAHEMVHVQQIRSMGMNPFACQYSAELSVGHGQECANTLEAEAYRLEARVDWALPINLKDLKLCGLSPPPDSDGDGVVDSADAFESNKYEWADMNGNGIGDNTDLLIPSQEGGIASGVVKDQKKEAVLMILNQYVTGGF